MADDEGAKTFTEAEVLEREKGLREKRDELLGKVKEFQSALEPWKGLDPAKVREVLAAHEQTQAELQKKTGDWDAREKTLREGFAKEHQAVVDPLKQEVTQLRGDLFDAVAVRDALEAIGSPAIKGNAKLLLPILRPELDVAVVDGRRVTVVKGPDGKPRYHTTTNALLTVEDRLKELRAVPEYGGAFQGTGASGGGAQSGSAGAGGSTIAAGDDKGFLANLGKIAKGEVKVA